MGMNKMVDCSTEEVIRKAMPANPPSYFLKVPAWCEVFSLIPPGPGLTLTKWSIFALHSIDFKNTGLCFLSYLPAPH